jgi:hypothetical protein
MSTNREDAIRLLNDAKIPLQSPNEAVMGISRIDLCHWLLQQWYMFSENLTESSALVTWSSRVDAEEVPEEFISCLEAGLGLLITTNVQNLPSTFGEMLFYLEKRLIDLWREPVENPDAIQSDFFKAFRETLDSQIPMILREVKPEENLREALSATAVEKDDRLKNAILRRFGVVLPLERHLWGINWEYWWFVFFGLGLWFAWKVILPIWVGLFILWLPLSAAWLSWLLHEMSCPAWKPGFHTLNDLSRYLLQEHRKFRGRLAQQLEHIQKALSENL